jgi:UDP-2,4-diacetamido-2,4,6-trideoxy-beta-L-altropyranose hydrolase
MLIRADATPQMGTGHVMRCIALATAARQTGMDTLLIGYFGVPWVLDRLSEGNIPHCCLESEKTHRNESLEKFLARVKQFSPDCVVLDGYHFDLAWQTTIMQAGFKLLLIDDYGHLPEYQCDLLLNQNFGAEAIRYRGEIGALLIGPHYTLLRPEFAQARLNAKDRIFKGKAGRVLINLGGGNFSHILFEIASTIENVVSEKNIVIRILAGSIPDQEIMRAFSAIPASLEILRNVREMPMLLLDTDLCISAAGSTIWELCCLGVPFLTLSLAENQESVARKLSEENIAPAMTIESLKIFLHDPYARSISSNAGMALVDGYGAQRVVSHFHHLNE